MQGLRLRGPTAADEMGANFGVLIIRILLLKVLYSGFRLQGPTADDINPAFTSDLGPGNYG